MATIVVKTGGRLYGLGSYGADPIGIGVPATISVDLSSSGCGLGPTAISVQTPGGASDVSDQLTDLVMSPEAQAVGAAVKQQAVKNPLAVGAGVAALLWQKSFIWGGLAYALAAYLLKPKVDVAVTSAGPALVVPPDVAAAAVAIANDAGAVVNVAIPGVASGSGAPLVAIPGPVDGTTTAVAGYAGYGGWKRRGAYEGYGVLVPQDPVRPNRMRGY